MNLSINKNSPNKTQRTLLNKIATLAIKTGECFASKEAKLVTKSTSLLVSSSSCKLFTSEPIKLGNVEQVKLAKRTACETNRLRSLAWEHREKAGELLAKHLPNLRSKARKQAKLLTKSTSSTCKLLTRKVCHK